MVVGAFSAKNAKMLLRIDTSEALGALELFFNGAATWLIFEVSVNKGEPI